MKRILAVCLSAVVALGIVSCEKPGNLVNEEATPLSLNDKLYYAETVTDESSELVALYFQNNENGSTAYYYNGSMEDLYSRFDNDEGYEKHNGWISEILESLIEVAESGSYTYRNGEGSVTLDGTYMPFSINASTLTLSVDGKKVYLEALSEQSWDDPDPWDDWDDDWDD